MDMFQDLLANNPSPQVSPEMLEVLGNKAAQLFIQNGVPLNDAIKQVVAEDSNLGDEHLRRIIEFANNQAFQQLFENSEDKNIHFDVADPAVIIRDLRDGGSPAHDGKPLGIGGKSDYQTPPTKPANGQDDMAQLSQLFAPQPLGTATGNTQIQKMAGVETETVFNHANPIDDVYDLNIKLRSARSHLTGVNEEHDGVLKVAQEEFYSTVKHEILSDDGAGLGGVAAALSKVASVEEVKEVFSPVVNRLLHEGIDSEFLFTSLTKHAGKVLNLEHPLITSWTGMQKAAGVKKITEKGLADIDKEIEKTAAFLKSHIKAV